MSEHETIEVSEACRELLARLGDIIIPSDGDMPSASQAGVHGRLLDTFLRSRDDLGPQLNELLVELAASGESSADVVSRLRTTSPDQFAFLKFVVAGSYLMSRDVCGRLGYPFQEALQVNPYEYVELVDSGLLDPVVDRGPIYRSDPR